MSFIIAVDGPAGSGKGTITKFVASKLSFFKLDTGALYRCVTLEIIKNKAEFDVFSKINVFDSKYFDTDYDKKSNYHIDFSKNDILKIVNIARNMKVKFVTNNNLNELDYVFLNDKDVTKEIRSNDVNNLISVVSTIKELREEMLIIQRNLAKNQNTIMEGRDIGTVVFPNADLKIYLNADIEERARRRYKENQEKGIKTTYEEVLKILKNRDKIDMGRSVAPLKKADDAIEIDSTNMTIEEVVNKVITLYEEKCLK